MTTKTYVPQANFSDLRIFGELRDILETALPGTKVPLTKEVLTKIIQAQDVFSLPIMLNNHFDLSAADSFWERLKEHEIENKSRRKQIEGAIDVFTTIWQERDVKPLEEGRNFNLPNESRPENNNPPNL